MIARRPAAFCVAQMVGGLGIPPDLATPRRRPSHRQRITDQGFGIAQRRATLPLARRFERLGLSGLVRDADFEAVGFGGGFLSRDWP